MKIDKSELKVWTCKIVIKDGDLPSGFDYPPRMAAEKAILDAGFEVIMNRSCWGGELDECDMKFLEEQGFKRGSDIYFAGAMDATEETQH